MDTTAVTFFSLSAKDQPGELARITALLMEAQVQIEGLWGFGTGHSQASVLVVPQDAAAFEAAARNAGWQFKPGVCFRLTGEDRIGALVETLRRVAEKKINLHAVDAMGMDGQFGCYLWCEEQQVSDLRAVLGV